MGKQVFGILALASIVTFNSGIAKADLWGEIAEVHRKATNAVHDVASGNRDANDRDAAWEAAKARDAQAQREFAERTRSADEKSTIEKITVLQEVLVSTYKTATAADQILSTQEGLLESLSQLQSKSISISKKLKRGQKQSHATSAGLETTTAIIDMMASATQDGATPAAQIRAYQMGIKALSAVAKESSMTVDELIVATAKQQIAAGDDISKIIETFNQQRLTLVELTKSLFNDAYDLDDRVSEQVRHLATISSVQIRRVPPRIQSVRIRQN